MGKLEEFKEERAVLYKRVSELDKSIETLENAQWVFEEGENIWSVDQFGNIQRGRWGGQAWSDVAFTQGHIFKTEKEARLEAQRRNLLQRFKMFRDKCNDGWKPDFNDHNSKKWVIAKNKEGMYAMWTVEFNSFSYFGCFKNQFDAERAIELFGDEIKELFVDCEGR
jgi:hypothetical protein